MPADGGRIPVILDCDPGHDDAVAILLAVASPELEVLAVTTTFANCTVEDATRNAIQVLDLVHGRTSWSPPERPGPPPGVASSGITSTAPVAWTDPSCPRPPGLPILGRRQR